MAAAYWIAKVLASDAPIELVRKTRLSTVETYEQKDILRDFGSQLGRFWTERKSAWRRRRYSENVSFVAEKESFGIAITFLAQSIR
jgi:hypothetical protein